MCGWQQKAGSRASGKYARNRLKEPARPCRPSLHTLSSHRKPVAQHTSSCMVTVQTNGLPFAIFKSSNFLGMVRIMASVKKFAIS